MNDNNRVFIRHRRSENSPATAWNSPAKFRWPVAALKVIFCPSGQILLLLYNILLLLQFLMKTLNTNAGQAYQYMGSLERNCLRSERLVVANSVILKSDTFLLEFYHRQQMDLNMQMW